MHHTRADMFTYSVRVYYIYVIRIFEICEMLIRSKSSTFVCIRAYLTAIVRAYVCMCECV